MIMKEEQVVCKKSYRQKLYERVLEGICEVKDIPVNDRGWYSMYGGLNIVEVGIGQFADLNISIEEQERLGIDSEEFEKRFENIDRKKEIMIAEWRGLILDCICETQKFSRGSKSYQEWFRNITADFKNNIEWTIEMYDWALVFLEVLRHKLIFDIIATGINKG